LTFGNYFATHPKQLIMKSIAQSLIVTILALPVISHYCSAAVIRADFTARVDSIYDDSNLLSSTVAVGQSGMGYFLYNTGLSDTNVDPNWGDYGPITNFVFVLGGHTFLQNTQLAVGGMVVVNDQFYFGDTFYWESRNNIDDVTGTFSTTNVGMALRQFESAGASIFSSDDLPSTLTIEDFASNNRHFYIEFEPGFQQVINMTVTSMSTQAIPEPSTLVLISIGAGALLIRRRTPIPKFRMPNKPAHPTAGNAPV
jgi:hypothetical protein